MRAFVYASSVASFLVFSYKRVESYNVGWRQLQWLSAAQAYSRSVLDAPAAPERCSGNSLPRHQRVAMGVLVSNGVSRWSMSSSCSAARDTQHNNWPVLSALVSALCSSGPRCSSVDKVQWTVSYWVLVTAANDWPSARRKRLFV